MLQCWWESQSCLHGRRDAGGCGRYLRRLVYSKINEEVVSVACTCGLHMLVSSAPGSFGTLIGSLLTDTGTCDVAGPVWLALTSLVLA